LLERGKSYTKSNLPKPIICNEEDRVPLSFIKTGKISSHIYCFSFFLILNFDYEIGVLKAKWIGKRKEENEESHLTQGQFRMLQAS